MFNDKEYLEFEKFKLAYEALHLAREKKLEGIMIRCACSYEQAEKIECDESEDQYLLESMLNISEEELDSLENEPGWAGHVRDLRRVARAARD
jgi:hypothetical protein